MKKNLLITFFYIQTCMGADTGKAAAPNITEKQQKVIIADYMNSVYSISKPWWNDTHDFDNPAGNEMTLSVLELIKNHPDTARKIQALCLERQKIKAAHDQAKKDAAAAQAAARNAIQVSIPKPKNTDSSHDQAKKDAAARNAIQASILKPKNTDSRCKRCKDRCVIL